MVPDIDARDTGTAGLSADFDSVWGSPTDFDDMSGLFGEEGMKNFLEEFPGIPSQLARHERVSVWGCCLTGTEGTEQT